jgi:hypothetical protein
VGNNRRVEGKTWGILILTYCRVISFRGMGYTGDTRSANKILVRKPTGHKPL